MTLSLYPARLPAGRSGAEQPRRGPARRPPAASGCRPVADLPEGDPAPGLAGGAGRLPAGDARPARRVRRLRDRPVPDLHGRRSSPSSSSASTPRQPALLSLVLVALSIAALAGELALAAAARASAPGPAPRRVAGRVALGRRRWPALAAAGHARRAGARRAARLARLLDGAGRLEHAALELDPRRRRAYGPLQRRGGRDRHAARGAGLRRSRYATATA